MLIATPQSKIFVYTPDADMRKGVDGLSGLVRSELRADPTEGSLFIFTNRRHDRLKILHFDGGGYWLYYRVLEAGTFERLERRDDAKCLTIDATELSMWLAGVSLAGARRRRRRYAVKQSPHAA